MSTKYNQRRGAKANKPRPPRVCRFVGLSAKGEEERCSRYVLKSGPPYCDDHDKFKERTTHEELSS